MVEQDLLAVRTMTCPRCGALPGKRCWDLVSGNPRRKTFLPRPHQARVDLVEDDALGGGQTYRSKGKLTGLTDPLLHPENVGRLYTQLQVQLQPGDLGRLQSGQLGELLDGALQRGNALFKVHAFSRPFVRHTPTR